MWILVSPATTVVPALSRTSSSAVKVPCSSRVLALLRIMSEPVPRAMMSPLITPVTPALRLIVLFVSSKPVESRLMSIPSGDVPLWRLILS